MVRVPSLTRCRRHETEPSQERENEHAQIVSRRCFNVNLVLSRLRMNLSANKKILIVESINRDARFGKV
jgi:hypothetical protein